MWYEGGSDENHSQLSCVSTVKNPSSTLYYPSSFSYNTPQQLVIVRSLSYHQPIPAFQLFDYFHFPTANLTIMPILHFVEARVLIGGQPAAEFEVPDRPDDAHRAARYILAEPDLTYSVEVRFLPGFRLYQARYLYSKLQCDADNVGQAKSIYTRHIQQRRRIVTQNSLFSKFDAYPAEDKTTAQWYKYKYTFGLLERSTYRSSEHGQPLF